MSQPPKVQSNMKPKNEKQFAILAWKTAIQDVKLTPLLKAIGKALTNAPCKRGTFVYAHELGRFSYQIADGRNAPHSHICALDYTDGWKGKWTVTNHDLEVYSDFEMWMGRYMPDNQRCETGRIAQAMKRKRMQQAYDRYKKTGLRREHCLLLEKMCWEVETGRGDWVSLFVQGKRPFGDSSRARSIYKILGWQEPKTDRCLNDKEEERAWNIFDELAFAAPDAATKASKSL